MKPKGKRAQIAQQVERWRNLADYFGIKVVRLGAWILGFTVSHHRTDRAFTITLRREL